MHTNSPHRFTQIVVFIYGSYKVTDMQNFFSGDYTDNLEAILTIKIN